MLLSKKSVGFIFVSILLFGSFISFVAAQGPIGPPPPTDYIGRFFGNFGQDIKDFATESLDFRNNNILITVLLYFLVFMVVASIVNVIPLFSNRHWVFQGVVAIVVTTLSVILIPGEILRLAVNPYSAFGVVVITIMPFVFMMFFVYSTLRNRFLRHAAWLIFTVALILLGIYTLGTGDLNTKPNWYSYIYFFGAIASALMIWIGEWVEDRVFRGEVAGGRARAQAYLDRRRLQMEFDELRAETEFGIRPGAGSRKRLGA